MYRIAIEYAGNDEWERLKPKTSIAEDERSWEIYCSIVPRKGDELRISGWGLRVVDVSLPVVTASQPEIKGGPAAYVSVRSVEDKGDTPLVNLSNFLKPEPALE